MAKSVATDLLLRKIEPALKEELEKRAREHGHSLSDEVKSLLAGIVKPPAAPKKMGTWMASLVAPEDRGDDLVFEIPGEIGTPPDFE
jgi:plasmid stability protein